MRLDELAEARRPEGDERLTPNEYAAEAKYETHACQRGIFMLY